MEKNRFWQFEERVQALIEGSFARLFAGRLQPREVALRLARAMEDHADLDEAGLLVAPNHYTVHLHPEDHAALLAAQPSLAVLLAQHVIAFAAEGDLRLETDPEIVLLPDPAITAHSVAVEARHARLDRQTTRMMAVPSPADEDDESPAEAARLPKAFLVLHGDRYIPLTRTVTNVGRRRDNTIVIDDRRVSRQHCQLRFRLGECVLYDLGSRGGTFVNNVRVSECVLRSGDVISLAGVPLVYITEDTGTPGASARDTQVFPGPIPGEDPR